MHPTFSIIIPHKEIPDLLMRCLQSIPVSEDIQVIVVDDNSADADTYLERYPELSRPYLEFIRTTKGGGAGYARNVGLEHAKGKWLLFADADDFYVDDMYSIICSYVDSRDVMVKHDIRFDEVMYADDAYCSLQIGYYARTIQVVNRVLYVVTYRPNSQMSDFCLKPNELRLRAEAAFRMDKFMLQNDFCREHRLKFFLVKMLTHDRRLFKYYFFKLEEIYPSKLSALRDICKNSPRRFKIKFYLYSLLVWTRLL